MNVLFASTQLYSIKLALLFQEQGWNPVYFFTNSENEKTILDLFPEAITHNYIDAVKGVPPAQLVDLSLLAVDPAMLHSLSDKEYIALSMMDRNDSNSNSFTYRERKEFYYQRIQYWQTILNKFNISTVIFEEEPHQANDYILYLVCGHLSIKTLMTVRTISDLGILPMEKFEIGSRPFLELYSEEVKKMQPGSKLKLPDKLEAYYTKLEGNYENVLAEHLWDQIDKVKKLKQKRTENFVLSQASVFFTKMLDLGNHFKRLSFIFNKEFSSDQKERRRTIYDSKLSYLGALNYKKKTIKTKSLNRKYYNSIATTQIDFEKPYIFCGLQYQPEKSTCPLGGRFVDQYLMIELLSKNLPAGWNLYVKEHPSQFVFEYTRYGDFFRGKRYYDQIAMLPNTYLVPLSTDIFKAIDSAEAVASVTGTLCWEAVMRGKFGLNFGYSWMKGCEGIIEVFSQDELLDALMYIRQNKIDTNKVKLFGRTIQSLGFNAAVGGQGQLDHKEINVDLNAQIHFRAYKWLLEHTK